MEIEKEIKQNKFKDEIHKLMINQLFTGKWITNLIAKQLKPFGLTNQQYNVLRILRGQGNNYISVNAISDRMIDKMSNVSRLIDKLVDKNLVQRKVNKDDRRQADIIINQKGLDLVRAIEETEGDLKSNFKSLSEEEAKQLNSLLDKLRG
ncbi:MarR family transcriptional regulator [Vicingaceae bacterium]|nr:MarR family transcriptional regulator [Vicingaceae bacterium]MDB9964493.1 MarR family transcriptional regulator [Vicingaceae bacterium]MDC1452282.1 MarR family transcriptional regulator [Vicingaceae bacterium]